MSFSQALCLPGQLILLLWLALTTAPTDAAVACNATHNPCEERLYKGSECRNGFCSNPFEKGCLTTLLRDEFAGDSSQDQQQLLPSLARRLQNQVRVCNSEDPPDAIARGICFDHALENYGLFDDYLQIRILSQNWESAFFASWILQILLSEILRIPTTIESGLATAKVNFYSPANDFEYGTSNNWAAIETANKAPNGDCALLNTDDNSPDDYQACGHLIGEFWGGNNLADLWSNYREGIVDTPAGLGTIGSQGLFVTKFTAQTDPTVLNLLGIAGEANRRKLAELFLRPTTWSDYCDLVSTNGCATPDGVAERAPTEDEVDRMHVSGLYTGYFRATEENDCDANPDTCTGHTADFPCGWSSYLVPQTHHHNIALKSSGKEGSGGYTYSQLVEMYAAANATKSNLMLMWWTPEALYSSYVDTDAQMQRVTLPLPSQECVDHRIRASQRCDYESHEERVGDARGACDEAPQLLQKIVADGLYRNTYESGVDEAKQSPAYEAVKAFQITELQLGTILQNWISTRNQDTYGFDPRFATCMFVKENLSWLEDFIPRTFPRVGHQQQILESTLFYVAITMGGLASVATMVTSVFTYQRRNGYVMKFSQVEFLYLLLLGLLFVSLGSMFLAIPPENWSCITIQWLVGLGYTLELVPLIVKVAAMSRMMSAAKRFKRIVLTRQQLFGTVAFFTGIMVTYLITWTILDPPQRRGEYTLTEDTTEDGEHIVTVGYYCTLGVSDKTLTSGLQMIYTHFVSVMLRVISFLLEGAISESYMAGLRSLIYSSDAICTLAIYFIPKLLKDDEKFYELTHTPQSSKMGRGSALTMGPSVILQKSRSGGSSVLSASGSKQFPKPMNEQKDSSSSVVDPEAAFDPVTTTAHSLTGHNNSGLNTSGRNSSGVSLSSARSKSNANKKDVIDSKVSWGGINFSEWVRSSAQESEESTEEDNHNGNDRHETVAFEKPVDVLKSKDSWAAGHITQLIHSEEEDHSSDNGGVGGEDPPLQSIAESPGFEEDDAVSAEPEQARKSLLPPANLPKAETSRFSYASSRINRTRNKHTASHHDDAFHDE